MQERLVAIGEIVRPHGLGGDLKVRSLTDRVERFGELDDCVIWDRWADTRARTRIERVRHHGDTVVLKLAGIDAVDAAHELVGRLVAVPERNALPLPDGHFYAWQLEGCHVETEDGQPVGVVTGIERGSAQDLWVVSDGGRERLVPAVPEIVVDVSLAARRIVIRPPEGLLEL